MSAEIYVAVDVSGNKSANGRILTFSSYRNSVGMADSKAPEVVGFGPINWVEIDASGLSRFATALH